MHFLLIFEYCHINIYFLIKIKCDGNQKKIVGSMFFIYKKFGSIFVDCNVVCEAVLVVIN